MTTKRKKSAVKEKIHALLSLAYHRLGGADRAIGVNELAAQSFSEIQQQFVADADEATILAHRSLKDEARIWLRMNTTEQVDDSEGDGRPQQLEMYDHLFQFLRPAYLVERNGDSFAVPVGQLTLDEGRAIISRMDAEAITLQAEADEMRLLMRLKFGIDVAPQLGDVEAQRVLEAPTA